jgi:hypothetical protein
MSSMHKPTIEKTSITILKPEPQDMSAYRNLFGKSNDVDLRESYKIVKYIYLMLFYMSLDTIGVLTLPRWKRLAM